uniref:Uncharacterized protein n=1 Tax=viral metagenome TaxID=1070528 RepID=A0A6M3L6R9_9ZZZZ
MKVTGMTAEEYEKEIGSLVGKNFASPVLSERLKKGQASLLSVETPLLLRALGVPYRNMSLIPAMDKKWGAALAEGMEALFSGVAKTDTGAKVIMGIRNLFKSGTGHMGADKLWYKIAGEEFAQTGKAEAILKEARDSLPDFSDDTIKRLRDAIEEPDGPHNHWGNIDNPYPVDDDILPAFNLLKGLLKERVDLHLATPGLSHKVIGRTGKLSLADAHKGMLRAVEINRKDLIEKFPKPDELQKIASEHGARAVKDYKEVFPAATGKELKKTYKTARKEKINALLEGELERAAQIAHDAYGRPSGYFPHVMNKDTRMYEAFQAILHDDRIKYRGVPASRVFLSASKGRHLKEHTVTELNRLFIEGLPYKFMDEVAAHIRKIGGEPLKNWQKWLGMQDIHSLQMYMEDPGQAISYYLTSSIRAVSQSEKLNMLVKMGGRPLPMVKKGQVTKGSFSELLGEKPYLLSPEGMRAVFGESWRTEIGEGTAAMYDALIKKNSLKVKNELGNLFMATEDNLDSIVQAQSAGVPIWAVAGDVVDDMHRLLKMSTNSDEMNNFLKLWDGATNFWKTWTLFPFPGYYLRNYVGNAWAAHIGGSFHALPKHGPRAIRFLKESGAWRLGRPGADKTLKEAGPAFESLAIKRATTGELVPPAEMLKGALDYNVLQGGLTMGELMQSAKKVNGKFVFQQNKGNLPKRIAMSLGPRGEIPQTAFWAGNTAENLFRLNHYFHRIEKGDSIYEAAMNVKRYFFDYNELSQFERKVMRRILPFYSWARFNTPLQIQALVQQPGKYGNLGRMMELMQSEDAKKFPKEQLPKWLGEQVGLPVRINRQTNNIEVAVLKSWLSAADIVNVTRPVRAFTELMHPAPKFMIERLSGKNLYTGSDIESFPGEPYPAPFLGMSLSRKQVHALKQARILNEANKLVQAASGEGELGATMRWANAFGVTPKIHGFDIETLKQRMKFDKAVRAGKYKRVINIAKKTGNKDILEMYSEKIADAKKTRVNK